MSIDQYVFEKRQMINDELARILLKDDIINESARYIILSPSNRWRPIVAIASAEMYNVLVKEILPIACAIEILHSTSIIIDDLPSFDNGLLRRGKPTLHRVYSEGFAILTSVYTHSLAHSLISSGNNLPEQIRERLSRAFYNLIEEMIAGEAMDIQSRSAYVDIKKILERDEKKSGALYGYSAIAGGIVGQADDTELGHLAKYGKSMGTAYQILDDILDIEAKPEEVGKDTGKDKDIERPTLPLTIGIEGSRRKVKELMQNSKLALSHLGRNTTVLCDLVDYIALIDNRIKPSIIQFK